MSATVINDSLNNRNLKEINLIISRNDLRNDVLNLLGKIRPNWDRSNVKYDEFSDGISNKIVGCYEGNKIEECADAVVIRIFGEKSNLIVDRNIELQLINFMAILGLGPPLECIFRNGIVCKFLAGECLDEISVRDPVVARLIAKEMVRWHTIPREICDSKVSGLNFSQEPFLFTKMRSWLEIFPKELSDPVKNARFLAEIPDKTLLLKETDLLERELSGLGSPVVLCHNDLLLKNIIFNKSSMSVTFIDYEYGAFNYEAFDIADHFAEYVGVAVVDFSRYPDKAYQIEWLTTYLKFKKEYENDASPICQDDVEKLYVTVNKFTLASHFFWAVWSTLQAQYSEVDFDYIEYAILKFGEYFKRKDEFLSLA